MKEVREEREMEECTFAPKTSENPEYFVSKSSFLEREMNWSESKTKKIQQKREKIDSLESSQFDFQPKINQNSDRIISRMKQKKATEGVSNSYMNKYLRTQKLKKELEGTHNKSFQKGVKVVEQESGEMDGGLGKE